MQEKNGSELRRLSQIISTTNWNIEFSNLRLLSKIGEGSFKEVWKGTFLGAPAAIGVYKGLMKGTKSEQVIEDIKKEVKILQ